MSKEKVNQESGWSQFFEMLTPAARSALDNKEPSVLDAVPTNKVFTEDSDQFAKFRESLTPTTREYVDELVEIDDVKEDAGVEADAARYCLVEGPDGEWSSVRLFKTADGLARRIGMLSGQDMIVWAFYGIPLRLTKGPQRYLFLPDQQTAIAIPMYQGGPAKVVPVDLLSASELQEDGFIGPPELAQTNPPGPKTSSLSPAKLTKSKDDDDDDEEEGDGVA